MGERPEMELGVRGEELGVSFAAKNTKDTKGESCEYESFFNAEAQRRREKFKWAVEPI